MPKGKKLKVVDIQNEEVIETVEQPTTETATEPAETIETPSAEASTNEREEPTEPVLMKKARAKPKSKNKSVDILQVARFPTVEEEVNEEVNEEPKEEPKEERFSQGETLNSKGVEPKEVVKTKKEIEKVACPRCNKMLTAKGLQYSHKCPADKIVKPEPTPQIIEKYIEKSPRVIERIIEKDRIIKQDPDYNNIPEEIIQAEIKKRQITAKEARMNKQMESVKKLSMNIA